MTSQDDRHVLIYRYAEYTGCTIDEAKVWFDKQVEHWLNRNNTTVLDKAALRVARHGEMTDVPF